MEKMIEGLT